MKQGRMAMDQGFHGIYREPSRKHVCKCPAFTLVAEGAQ
jgi:hypothetical protein